MGKGEGTVPKRVRAWGVAAALLLVLLSILNLVLAVEGAPEVDPGVREGRTWQTGSGAPEKAGRHTWTFLVDPQGSRIVDLGIEMPYTVRTTHVAGEATLEHQVAFWVDGTRVEEATERVVAEPQDNETTRVSRTRTVAGDFDTDLRIERDAEETEAPFVLLVTWDWALEHDDGADVTFQTVLRPVSVTPVDAGGLPGCGSGCARTLVVIAVVGQVAAFVWYRRAPEGPDAPPPATPGHAKR